MKAYDSGFSRDAVLELLPELLPRYGWFGDRRVRRHMIRPEISVVDHLHLHSAGNVLHAPSIACCDRFSFLSFLSETSLVSLASRLPRYMAA